MLLFMIKLLLNPSQGLLFHDKTIAESITWTAVVSWECCWIVSQRLLFYDKTVAESFTRTAVVSGCCCVLLQMTSAAPKTSAICCTLPWREPRSACRCHPSWWKFWTVPAMTSVNLWVPKKSWRTVHRWSVVYHKPPSRQPTLLRFGGQKSLW